MPKPRLQLSVQRKLKRDERADAPTRPQILRWARAALISDAPDTSVAQVLVTVRLVGEAEGRALNQTHRGKKEATNVLTFVYGEMPSEAGTILSGDIALCAPLVLREAAEQGKAPEAHYAHLVIHGILHLQGYEHETNEADAHRMEARERAILAALGFSSPYEG